MYKTDNNLWQCCPNEEHPKQLLYNVVHHFSWICHMTKKWWWFSKASILTVQTVTRKLWRAFSKQFFCNNSKKNTFLNEIVISVDMQSVSVSRWTVDYVEIRYIICMKHTLILNTHSHTLSKNNVSKCKLIFPKNKWFFFVGENTMWHKIFASDKKITNN